jgi:hypothetical protein
MLTLVIVPVVYTFLARFAREKRPAEAAVEAPEAGAVAVARAAERT